MIEALAVVSFCLAFFAGGYSLGRLAQPGGTGFGVDPDPLREPDERAFEAEHDVVVPIGAAKSARRRAA
jgi:hypothetical protein